MATRDDLIHRAINAHHQRTDERERAKAEHDHEQAARGVRFVTDYKDHWNEYVGTELFGDPNAAPSRREWFIPGEVRAAYELHDEGGVRYDQRPGPKPARFHVASWIAGDALLTLTVDPFGNPTSMSVNIDGYARQQVKDLADIGEQIESQRAGKQYPTGQ